RQQSLAKALPPRRVARQRHGELDVLGIRRGNQLVEAEVTQYSRGETPPHEASFTRDHRQPAAHRLHRRVEARKADRIEEEVRSREQRAELLRVEPWEEYGVAVERHPGAIKGAPQTLLQPGRQRIGLAAEEHELASGNAARDLRQ